MLFFIFIFITLIEAEVERFSEDQWELLELTLKN